MLSECKQCGTSREIKLRLNRDNSYTPVCTHCGAEQDNMSQIMINMMRMNKDIIRDSGDTHVPFGVECKTCGRKQEVIYDKATRSAVCSVCGKTVETTPYMLRCLEISSHVLPSKEDAPSFDGGE